MLNEQKVSILIDTGAEVNVLPKDWVKDIEIQPTQTVIKAWGNFPILVLGRATISVRYDSKFVFVDVFGVDLPSSIVLPLLSFELCRELAKKAELPSLNFVPVLGQNSVSHCSRSSTTDEVLSRYQNVFNRRGTLITGYEYSITMKSDAIHLIISVLLLVGFPLPYMIRLRPNSTKWKHNELLRK